jgi:hypothetical protein
LPEAPQHSASTLLQTRDRQIAHLSFNFALDMASHGIPGLKLLESLLMMAINQANIAPLTRDPAARLRYGALDTPAPDDERRPVSMRAVATSMGLPYETARRNIRRLETKGVCTVSDAGVVVPASFMLSAAYFEAARQGHEKLYALYRMLRVRDLFEPLPAANYDDDEPQVRAAVRLLSDFLLRVADAVVRRTGDLISAIVLLPLIATTAGADQGRPPAAIPVAVLARRTRLPAETVRRHAAQLVSTGLCLNETQGLSLADPTLAAGAWDGLLRENAIAVQRLFAGLAERGLIAAWERLEAAAARTQGAA